MLQRCDELRQQDAVGEQERDRERGRQLGRDRGRRAPLAPRWVDLNAEAGEPAQQVPVLERQTVDRDAGVQRALQRRSRAATHDRWRKSSRSSAVATARACATPSRSRNRRAAAIASPSHLRAAAALHASSPRVRRCRATADPRPHGAAESSLRRVSLPAARTSPRAEVMG